MTENKQYIHKLQNDTFKNAFNATLFAEDSASSAHDYSVIDSIGDTILKKSILWITEESTLFDNFFFELFEVKKKDAFSSLINGYYYIQHELTKQSNLMYPKIKEFLESLFNYTLNYSKIIFIEKDFLNDHIIKNHSSYPEALGSLLFDHSFNNGFPKAFIEAIRSEINAETYKVMMESFYKSILSNIANVNKKNIIDCN